MKNCEVKSVNISVTKITDGYDEKYIKIKFNLDDELSLNKTI